MHIIVEGIDRCGKSSTIREMMRLLPGYELRKLAPPTTRASAIITYTRFFNELTDGGNVIWDRGHISEAVYAGLYRDYSIVDMLFRYEREALKQNPFIKLLYFFPVYGTLLSDDSRPGADRVAELFTYDNMLVNSEIHVTKQSTHSSMRREWISPELRAYRALHESGILP